MTDEQIIEAKQIYVAAPVLLPMIKEKQETAYQRLLHKFRNDGEVSLAQVAECNAYTILLEEVTYKINSLKNIEETN